MPWPEEEVVVQQGCSRLEELGLFPCSRPTAGYVHSLASESNPGSRAESSLLKLIVKILVQGRSQDFLRGFPDSCAQSAREKFNDHAHFSATPSN